MNVPGYKNIFLGILLVLLIAYGSYSLGRQGYDLDLVNRAQSLASSAKNSGDPAIDFSLFWKVYDLLNQKYLGGPVDVKKLIYGAAEGLYRAVGDPYTVFLPPTENKEVASTLSGKYEGIGAELGMKSGQLVVVAPLDGSPAAAAGLRTGDSILKIDGKETVGITLNEAVNQIRGEAGTRVTLSIKHVDTTPLQSSDSAKDVSVQEISVIRAPIKVESVKWEEKGNGVVYIRASRFGDTTDAEWDAAVLAIKSKMKSPKALILDIRSNPGGYFEAAVHLASEFIGDGVVSYQEFSHGLRQEYKVDHVGAFVKVPGIVLINGGSASASEIVAGALRDRRGFKVVGEKSFGKGTVQDAETFDDGSGVHITIARWLTPKGYNIHGAGITPDVKVELTEVNTNSGRDPQLERALEMAKTF